SRGDRQLELEILSRELTPVEGELQEGREDRQRLGDNLLSDQARRRGRVPQHEKCQDGSGSPSDRANRDPSRERRRTNTRSRGRRRVHAQLRNSVLVTAC